MKPINAIALSMNLNIGNRDENPFVNVFIQLKKGGSETKHGSFDAVLKKSTRCAMSLMNWNCKFQVSKFNKVLPIVIWTLIQNYILDSEEKIYYSLNYCNMLCVKLCNFSCNIEFRAYVDSFSLSSFSFILPPLSLSPSRMVNNCSSVILMSPTIV